MTAVILELRPNDRVCQDAGPIALMYRSMGAQAAEEVVARALGELALTMSDLAEQVPDGPVPDVCRRLRRLQRMAEQLGLVSLGHVAEDARICLEIGDLMAFDAVWARLVRVAQVSFAMDKGAKDRHR